MNSIWTIARKELSDSLRNRWLMAISLVFATLALGIAWFGAAASGQVGYASTPATIASPVAAMPRPSPIITSAAQLEAGLCPAHIRAWSDSTPRR